MNESLVCVGSRRGSGSGHLTQCCQLLQSLLGPAGAAATDHKKARAGVSFLLLIVSNLPVTGSQPQPATIRSGISFGAGATSNSITPPALFCTCKRHEVGF